MILIELWQLISQGKKFRTLTKTKLFHGSLSHSQSGRCCKFASCCKSDIAYTNKSCSRH